MHGPLLCIEVLPTVGNAKYKELQVFLFEQTMIFSEAVGKKTQFTNPVYIHKAHIQVCIKCEFLFISLIFTQIMSKLHYLSHTGKQDGIERRH